MRKKDPEMTAIDVIEFLRLVEQNRIDVRIDGGWGMLCSGNKHERTTTWT
jgi:hypothetical protein